MMRLSNPDFELIVNSSTRFCSNSGGVTFLRNLICAAVVTLCLSACADNEPEQVQVQGQVPDKLVWQQVSEQGAFEVTLDAQTDGSVAINEFLEWVLTVKKPDGEMVTPARVAVSGGMPAHGHGLPSQPQVSEHPVDGKYLVKGLQFSMNGNWELAFDIQSQDQRDKVVFDLNVDY